METTVTTKITISSTPKKIFKYLCHLKYHYLWNPHLRKIHPVTSLKLGQIYETESLLLGIAVKGKNTVTKFISEQELQIENSTGSIQYSVNYRLSAKPDHVVLTCITRVSSKQKIFKFTATVMKTLAQRELQSDLQALKIAAEQQLR